MKKMEFAVIGAGSGGQIMAAKLSMDGYSVKLYDIDSQKIQKLKGLGEIKVSGKIVGTGKPEVITTDIKKAAEGADVIMVVTTTDAHADVASSLMPYLRDGQIVVLNPGQTGGALEFSNVLKENNCKAKPIIAETQDLLYGGRTNSVGDVFVSGIKRVMGIATLPGKDIDHVLEVLGSIFPQFKAMPNVLYTSLDNMGSILHPIPTLLNINKIDLGQPFEYYMEGITPSVANIMVEADKERLAVGKALGIELTSISDWLKASYGLEDGSLYEILQSNKAYVGVKPPQNTNHRFLYEDTLSGIVPLASLGAELGIKTPVLDAFINIASIVSGRDYRKEGRTAEKLGLAGKTAEEIHKIVS